jgi:hypothetical protein
MSHQRHTGEARRRGAPGVLTNRSPMLAWQAQQALAQKSVGPCPHCGGLMHVVYSAAPEHPKALIARCLHVCGHEHLVYVANVGPLKYSEPYRPDLASTAATYDAWCHSILDRDGDMQARWAAGLTGPRLPNQPHKPKRRPTRDS